VVSSQGIEGGGPSGASSQGGAGGLSRGSGQGSSLNPKVPMVQLDSRDSNSSMIGVPRQRQSSNPLAHGTSIRLKTHCMEVDVCWQVKSNKQKEVSSPT
jgi:hypothetical protein